MTRKRKKRVRPLVRHLPRVVAMKRRSEPEQLQKLAATEL